jgi:hypothetical protein
LTDFFISSEANSKNVLDEEIIMEMVGAIIDNNNNNKNEENPAHSSDGDANNKFKYSRQRDLSSSSPTSAGNAQQRLSEMNDMKMEEEEEISKEFSQMREGKKIQIYSKVEYIWREISMLRCLEAMTSVKLCKYLIKS